MEYEDSQNLNGRKKENQRVDLTEKDELPFITYLSYAKVEKREREYSLWLTGYHLIRGNQTVFQNLQIMIKKSDDVICNR